MAAADTIVERDAQIVPDYSREEQDGAQKIEAFAERMLGLFNDAALTLMVSIGHRTGLFDVLADFDPSTSEEIAEASGLNERYVREWLGAMTTGGIVQHNPNSILVAR